MRSSRLRSRWAQGLGRRRIGPATSRPSGSRTSVRRPCLGTRHRSTDPPRGRVAEPCQRRDLRGAARSRSRTARARAHRSGDRRLLLRDEGRWILDKVPGAQARAAAGELLCGTIDTWLIWKLTGGRVHVTDVSNASRTMVFDIHRQRWDDELLGMLDLPRAMFAAPCLRRASSARPIPGISALLYDRGIAGDQQAALFGQTCFAAGEAKNTYGTGCFVLANTGATAAPARGGLLTTIAGTSARARGTRSRAVRSSPAPRAVAARRPRHHRSADETRRSRRASPATRACTSCPRSLVWARRTGHVRPRASHRDRARDHARRTSRARRWRASRIRRATSSRQWRAAGQRIDVLRADGGGTANRFLMQFQSDLLGIPWRSPRYARPPRSAPPSSRPRGRCLEDAGPATRASRYCRALRAEDVGDEREGLYARWQRAVERSRGWAAPRLSP